MAEENVYRCEGCGGIMEFDAATQSLKCPNCDSVVEIISEKQTIVEHRLDLSAKKKLQVAEKTTQTMECTGCGAQIEVDKNETAAQCPYCGSNYVLASKQEEIMVPDAVVPFQLDQNAVKDSFRKWIKGRWLAPSSLKNLYQHGGFRGIYLPYWTFDAQSECWYTAQGGRERTVRYKDSEGNTRTRTEVDWYFTKGHFHHFFDDVQIPASKRFGSGMFKGIGDFDFKRQVPYAPEYISGFLAENFNVSLDEGHGKAVMEMDSELRSMSAADVRKRYDRVKDVHINRNYTEQTFKYLLLPVYSTSYSYNGKDYNVLINGQSGKVSGEYPKSPVKIAIIVVIIIAILFWVFMDDASAAELDYEEQNVMEITYTNTEFLQDVVEKETEEVAYAVNYDDVCIVTD